MNRKNLLSMVVIGTLYSDMLYADLKRFDDRGLKLVEKKDLKNISNDEIMDGFDDDSEDTYTEDNGTKSEDKKTSLIEGLTGKITEQVTYSYSGTVPHDKITSLKTSLFLDYEHKFENSWRIKTNGRWYYDGVYDLRDETYSNDELKAQRDEIELFDAYVEGSFSDTVDMKLGRQVVVWGRSDTIRITDVLNPIDNRRPGMVDIEDLRLPTTMLKLDLFYDKWRITPIVMLEQRFTKNPSFGSSFNPMENPHLAKEKYNDITYALSIGGEFSGWDVNFYAARMHNDEGYIKFTPQPIFTHNKVNMFGTALNVLSGAWLFKTELAYFNGLKYTSTQEQEFSRTDALIGVEYKGIADTTISYDVSLRHISDYTKALLKERNPLEENTYQHAFRVTSDFMNATLHANYLISLFGEKLDMGGFQRAWLKYDVADATAINVGVVDYIAGSVLFDSIKDNDMIFADISYNF